LGKVFFEKESEKTSEEKLVEKPSGEKPSEQPHPKPKPKVVKFHCDYCGRDGHKSEFCFKRKREERMTKEWANKDKYHPPNGVLEPCVQMPRAKASVRTVPAWEERKAAGGVAGGVKLVRPIWKPVRPVWRQQGGQFGFRAREESRFVAGGRGSGGWFGEFACGQFARRSPPRAQYEDGRSCGFEVERRNDPWSSFVVLVLLQVERVGSPIVVTVVVFVEIALIGEMFWSVLTPLWRKWLGTAFTLLVLTPMLSRLFIHVLVFEFQVGDLKNIWLFDSSCSRHMTRDKGWFSSPVPVVKKRYITFGDNG
jgi:hypothetical protein